MKFKSDIEVQAGLKDSSGSNGTSGQVLSSNGTTVSWVPAGSSVASDVQNEVKAGVAIGKGQAVYVTGADGTNIIVGLASNTTEATSSKTLGLLNATVAANGFADVVQIGRLDGLNTSAATVGDPVWLGANGNLIYGLANKPYAPLHLVFIGVVTRVNANNGEIFINVQNGFELNEIHDVDIKTTVPINGDVLGYDGTLWVNKTIAGWLGYTPADQAITISTTAPLSGGGNLSANRTLSITQAGTASSGYLSSTDWNTFNNKQGALTFTSPLVNTSGAVSITLATTSTNGYLSSTDWNTFNGKQTALNGTGFVKASGTTISYDNSTYVPTSRTITINGVGYDLSADRSWTVSGGIGGSGTTNKIPKFTAATTIGDSIITDNGTTITISGTGTGGSATLKVNTSTATTFVHSQENMAANLTTGQHNISVIGKEANTKNAGYIGYYWAGAASNANFVTIGHWGNDDLLRVYGGGEVVATVSMQAPIFYDSDNTVYYANFAAAGTSINIAGSLNAATYNAPAILVNSSGTGSAGSAIGMQQVTAEGWTGIFVDFEPNTGWGLYHDNPSNYFLITAETTTGSIGSNVVPSRSSGNRTAHTKFQFQQTDAVGIAGGSWRAPVFYDFNDTAYYIDPNSTTTSVQVAGAIEQGNNLSRPLVQWGVSGDTTGAVIIKLPGTTASNYGMVHAVIDVYEYNSNNVCTIIIGGHNWSTQWYNYGAQVVGYTNKPVRLAVKDGKYCIVIGNGSSVWSYGQVVLRKIQNGTYYNNQMDLGGVYSIGIESDTYSWVSGDLRELKSNSIVATDNMYAPRYYDRDNANYYLDPASTSILNSVAAYGTVTIGSGGSSYLYMYDSDEGTRALHCNSNRIGFLTQSESWGSYCVDNGDWVTDFISWAGASSRAPIFYDSNDTGYYVDPASNSSLNILSIGGDKTLSALGGNGITGTINAVWGMLKPAGYKIYQDEEFSSGSNSVNVYNNVGGSGVTITRKNSAFADSSASPMPNSSGWLLEIRHAPTESSGTTPGYGGFYFGTSSAPGSKRMICVFKMKIPAGRTIEFASNSIGVGGNSQWLTNNSGTGQYQDYAFIVNSGTSGWSSTFFFYINGGSTATFYTYLASATVYDVTNVSNENARVQSAGEAMYSPIYYDANDSAYFLDLASTGKSAKIAGYLETYASANKAVLVGNWNGANYWGFGSDGAHTIKLDMVAADSPTFMGASDINLMLGTRTVLHSGNYSSYNSYGQLISYAASSGTGLNCTMAAGLNGGTGAVFNGSTGLAYGSSSMTVYGSSYGAGIKFITGAGGYTNSNAAYFYSNTTLVGSISCTTTNTTYATSSDYRLKENIIPMESSIARVMELKPCRFNFIIEKDKVVDGFIAHEVQEVVPEAATGEKDEIDPEGNPIYQGIDQSKLVPLLTSALQEAILKIEELENRLSILENK